MGVLEAHSNDILMLQLFQVLHFADGGHVKPILELANFDLLDCNSLLCTGFVTLVDNGVRSFSDLLVLYPIQSKSRLHELAKDVDERTISSASQHLPFLQRPSEDYLAHFRRV